MLDMILYIADKTDMPWIILTKFYHTSATEAIPSYSEQN